MDVWFPAVLFGVGGGGGGLTKMMIKMIKMTTGEHFFYPIELQICSSLEYAEIPPIFQIFSS